MATVNSPNSSTVLSEKKDQASLYKHSNRAMVESMDIIAYMKVLPASIWSFIFTNSAALQAILRSLSELDQLIITRLCYLQHTVSEKAMRLWVQTESITELRRSIAMLVNLHILTVTDDKRSEFSQYKLEPTIKKQIQTIFLNGPSKETLKYVNPVPNKYFLGKHHHVYPSKSVLINHSQTRWDNLLRFIVSPNDLITSTENGQESLWMYSQADEEPPERPCEEVVFILVRRHLVSYSSAYTHNSKERSMSREAFSWLLKDLRSQIISIVMEFLFLLDGGNLSSPASYAEIRSITNAPNTNRASLQTFTAAQINEKRQRIFPEMYVDNIVHPNPGYPISHTDGTQNFQNRKNGKAEFDNQKDHPSSISGQDPIEHASALVQESLLFLLGISQASIGQPFYTHTLSSIQKRFLRVFYDLGLIWMQNTNSSVFFVAPYSLLLRSDGAETRSLTAAMSSLSTGISHRMKRRIVSNSTNQTTYSSSMLGESWFHPGVLGCPESNDANLYPKEYMPINSSQTQPMDSSIIVQSNFKVYIYTSSALHISVLSHLCELQARTTNLVVGILTRESVSAAYKSGITADQIIRFLESHSHPAILEHQKLNYPASTISNSSNHTALNVPSNANSGSKTLFTSDNPQEYVHLLPENVIIQLKMWEAEQHRLTMEAAVLFKNWQNDLLPELFQKCVRWALGKGYCLYHTPWPEDTESDEFEQWLKQEKYLVVSSDSKSEMVEKIREFREVILSHRSGKNECSGGDLDDTNLSNRMYGFLYT